MQPQKTCSCIARAGFHLVVTYTDQQTIVLQDRSRWVDDEGFLRPGSYELKVTLPNDTVVPVTVATDGYILSEQELGSPVEDGVYVFEVPAIGSGCGIQQTQRKFLYPGIMCRLMKARLRVKANLQPDVEKIADSIAVMKAAAETGQEEQALDLYRKITLNLDALQCDCNCTPNGLLFHR